VAEKTGEELPALRASRQFGLLLDGVRAPGPAPRDVEIALRTVASPEAAKRAPKTSSVGPRELGRSLPLGVVGELCCWGSRRATFSGLEAWQLGAVSLRQSS
jgi:hypothetical protein